MEVLLEAVMATGATGKIPIPGEASLELVGGGMRGKLG